MDAEQRIAAGERRDADDPPHPAASLAKIEAVFEPGSVIEGKYRVEHVLGDGGMGVVVAAEHVELRTRVALKFLADELARHDVVVERFLREARACARLRSEHVCRVFDVGRLDDGAPYLVMELLEGDDLARMLLERGPLDPATAATTSCRRASRSPRRTRPASCIAISSRRTCSWRTTTTGR